MLLTFASFRKLHWCRISGTYLKMAILALLFEKNKKKKKPELSYVLLMLASISMHCFDSLASQVSLDTEFHTLENF